MKGMSCAMETTKAAEATGRAYIPELKLLGFTPSITKKANAQVLGHHRKQNDIPSDTAAPHGTQLANKREAAQRFPMRHFKNMAF